MVGRATLTTVLSSIAILDPSTAAASTQRPFGSASRILPAICPLVTAAII
jgi:hypothetical protein